MPLNWYPHLGSYIWAFFWKNSVLEYEYFGRIFFIFIFVLSIFTLIPRLSNKFSIVEKLLIIFCIIYLSTNFYLLGGYQEYLIFFSFFIFSYFFLFVYKHQHLFKKSYIPEIIFLLIINIIIWTKQEGFFYFIILGLLFLLYGKRNINQKILFFIISSLLLIFFIFIKKYYFGQFQFNEKIINSELINNFDFFILFKKITLIVKYFFITFVKYPIWIVIFLCLFVLKYKYKLSYENKFYYTFLFLSFSFVIAIFLHTTMDLNFLIPVTLNRIVFAISGFYIVLIVDILNRLRK